jgi:hypothetical protein
MPPRWLNLPKPPEDFTTMTKLVELVQNKQAVEFQTAINEIMTSKILVALEAKKAELATNIFMEDVLTEDTGERQMSHGATELTLHGDNTFHLYHSSHEPIMKNLAKKQAKGTYKPELATKLWRYHADRVAQDYHKTHGSPDTPWHKAFPTSERNEAARHWETTNRSELHHYVNESYISATEDEFLTEAKKEFKFRTYKGVKYVAPHGAAPDHFARCGTCHRAWDDYKSTDLTPTPSGRCPFEYMHKAGK